MLDVDFGDLIDYLGNDPLAKSILLYIESLTNFRKFMSAARAVSRVKPIIVLKAGRSEAGAKAAASHTGAMAGEDAVYDAAFKRAGIVRVDTIQDLFDCAELMAKQPRPLGPRLAIVSNGGGPGVMATDTLARYGLDPAPLAPETFQKLDAFLPSFWSRGNPVDILGDASAERFRRTLEICFEGKDTDGVCVIRLTASLSFGRKLPRPRTVPPVWAGPWDIRWPRSFIRRISPTKPRLTGFAWTCVRMMRFVPLLPES